MEDKSFLNLTTDTILEKIDIDPRLIPSFKRIMEKLQNYFNANGYTLQRDYANFFEKYLISGDSTQKLQIQLNNEPSKSGADGFYEHQTIHGRNRLVIDEQSLVNEVNLDHIFMHEFIHFLVMRAMDKIKLYDTIVNKAFVNEALTELLTRQVDGAKYQAYVPQIEMMIFANSLSGNVNNYQRFLDGILDPKSFGSAWIKFLNDTKAYQVDKIKKNDLSFKMSEAITDPNYINAQRSLINSYIYTHLVKDLDTYFEKISVLSDRPVGDHEFINGFFNSMDNNFLSNLGITSSQIRELIKVNLVKLRETVLKLNDYEGKDVYEFEFMGHTIALDKAAKNYNMRGLSNIVYSNLPLFDISLSFNPSDSTITFRSNQDKSMMVKLNIRDIDFEKRKRDLISKKEKLSACFSINSKKDIQMVWEVAQTRKEIIKLEKYTLPRIGFDKKYPPVIYIAHYKDRIEVLDSLKQIGVVENVEMARYIGVTAKENGLISLESLGTIENGYRFSVMSEKAINSRAVSMLRVRYSSVDENKMKEMVTIYKQSSSFQNETDIKDLRDNAIWYFANRDYDNLTFEQKRKLKDQVINQKEQVVVSSTNGDLNVSLLFGDKTVFKSKCETLVDIEGDGLYNEIFKELSKNRVTNFNDSENTIILMDSNRNIQITRRKDEGNNSYVLNTDNNDLVYHRNQYNNITSQINDLTQKNILSPVQNYQELLSQLQQRKERIQSQIAVTLESQRLAEPIITRDHAKNHNNIIGLIEKSLGTRITSIKGYLASDSVNKPPQAILKSQTELMFEQDLMLNKIEHLCETEKIDRLRARELKDALNTEYEKMIPKAPKQVCLFSSNKFNQNKTNLSDPIDKINLLKNAKTDILGVQGQMFSNQQQNTINANLNLFDDCEETQDYGMTR